MNILYLLKNNQSTIEYFDYLIMLGQSNMAGITTLSTFDEKYRSTKSSFKKYMTSLINYTAPANGQWAWVVLHELSELYPDKQFNCIHVAFNGSYCHTGGAWNAISNSIAISTTIDRIRGIKSYATSIGKVARCTGIFWDQKENDTGYPTYVQYSNGVLSGDFVDTISTIKTETGGNPWMIFSELMTYQNVAGGLPAKEAMIAMQRLYVQHTTNTYLLPMNINQQYITSSDSLHYDANGCKYVGLMARDIIVDNNLII